MTSSTFNFRIELADKDCNEKSYDVVKNKSTPQLERQLQQTKLQEQKQKIKELKAAGYTDISASSPAQTSPIRLASA